MTNDDRIARRAELQQSIDEILLKGVRHSTEDSSGEMVDNTDEWLAELQRKVANLDALVAGDQG
jgi:hypothetical protein